MGTAAGKRTWVDVPHKLGGRLAAQALPVDGGEEGVPAQLPEVGGACEAGCAEEPR